MATVKASTKRQLPQDAECEVALSATPKRTCQADIGNDTPNMAPRQVDNDDAPLTPGISSVAAVSYDDDDSDGDGDCDDDDSMCEICCNSMEMFPCWCVLSSTLPAHAPFTSYAKYFTALKNLKDAYLHADCTDSEVEKYLNGLTTIYLEDYFELCEPAQAVVLHALKLRSTAQKGETHRIKKLHKRFQYLRSPESGAKAE